MARILVADDEAPILDVIQQTCALDGHEVRPVSTVDEAVSAYVDFAPALMILDVRMPPDGGALRILERLDALGGTGTCAVIVISGGIVEDEASGLVEQDRVRHVIQKPFAIQDMRDAIKASLAEER